ALTELGPAVDQRAAGSFVVFLDLDVFARIDPRSTPGTVRQLMRRSRAADRTRPRLATVRCLDRFIGIARPVGRGAAADLQADAKWRFAPAIVALAQGRAANLLAGVNQSGGALELLEREQAQRVSHQHGHAAF